MPSTTKSTLSIVSLLTALLLGGATTASLSQVIVLDNGAWATPTFEVEDDGIGEPRLDVSTLSDAIGEETDLTLVLTQSEPGATASVEARPEYDGFRIRSSSGTKTQAFFSLDGTDFSTDVRASDGIEDEGIDITGGGVRDRFVLSFDNQGPAFKASIAVYSAPDQSSSCVFDVPVSVAEIDCPYKDFQTANSGANLEAVHAIILLVGAEGGADGPMNVRVSDFGVDLPPTVPPNPSGDEVVLYEQAGVRSGESFPASNYGNEAGGAFNAEVAEDIKLAQAATITRIEIDTRVIGEGDGSPIRANFSFLEDNSGRPGNPIEQFDQVQAESIESPLSFKLPEGVPVAPDQRFWVAFEAITTPGHDVGVWTSIEEFGQDAHWRNPGGGFNLPCSEWKRLIECATKDHSFGLTIHGTIQDEQEYADVGVGIEPVDTTYYVSDTVHVEVTVENLGSVSSPETEVVVLTPSLDVLQVAPSQGTCEGRAVDVDKARITCNLGLLAPTATALIDVRFIVDRYTVGPKPFFASFRPGEFPDEVSENNDTEVSIGTAGRLAVTKLSPTRVFMGGRQIPFRIFVRNESDEPVSGVSLTDNYYRRVITPTQSGPCAAASDNELTCDIGTLGPGEERFVDVPFVANETGVGANRVRAFSSRGLEGKDEFQVSVVNEAKLGVRVSLIGFDEAGFPRSSGGKRAFDPIDVYLNDSIVADDINIGQATPFVPITLTEYPFFLYLVPGDAPDRLAAFDTIRVELSGAEEGVSSGIVVTVDEEGANHAVLVDSARSAASQSGQVDVTVIHAAPALAAVDVTLMTGTDGLAIADNLVFGQVSPYVEIETPGAYNLVVTPDGGAGESEFYRLDLDKPGEAYQVVIAPDQSMGKLDGVVVYTIDSEGNVVQPALVTSADDTAPELPTAFALYGNYPNPFNPSTTIPYDVPEAAKVDINVFDALGRIVASLGTSHRSAGTYTVTWDAKDMPSGIYFVRMRAGTFVETRKMVLLR